MAKKKHKEVQPVAEMKRPAKPVSSTGVSSLLLVLLIVTVICFSPVARNGFLNFDDPQYVTENPTVQKLSSENVKRFFSEQFVGNYQPIVMLTYALEYKFFALHAGGYHFFSLLMHLLNTALVFFLAKKLLGNDIGAFITAMLFGIHPLHVESVAWVASQKDLLYTFFFLASSLFYVRFVKEGQTKYFILAALLFVFSLLSKAQAVVLPVVFLLYDMFLQRRFTMKTILEKVPLLILSALFGLLALQLQKSAGAVQDAVFTKYERVEFASYGFVYYLWQTIIPIKLSIFYPYPETDMKINSMLATIAPLLVLAVTVAVFFLRKRSVVIFAGYLFFCVTIALVIQLIPVGDAIHADRYTYISLIGFFLVAGYYFSKYYKENASQRNTLIALASVYFIVIGALTFNRTQVFRDSITVYSDALQNYPAPITYSNRGAELYKEGKYQESLEDFIAARTIKPRFPNIWFNSGLAHQQLNQNAEAISDYTEALKYNNDINTYVQRAYVFKAQGNLNAALLDFTKVIELNAGVVNAYYERAEIYGRLGKANEALDDLNRVISMKPDYIDAYNNRAIANSMAGNMQAALDDYNKVLEFNPKSWNTYFNRSVTLKNVGRYKDALSDALTAKNNGYPVDDKYLQELQALAAK